QRPSEAEGSARPGPAGVFPLRLRRQAVGAAGRPLRPERRQLLAERDRFGPGHALDRPIVPPELRRVVADDEAILALRNFVAAAGGRATPARPPGTSGARWTHTRGRGGNFGSGRGRCVLSVASRASRSATSASAVG